ncbi:hypothetical protein AGMMS49944_01030 [Spirochaetia bacterium]|nr:hypothetical protein AGMMS49944_01030 [Spirochaetia bacterium]
MILQIIAILFFGLSALSATFYVAFFKITHQKYTGLMALMQQKLFAVFIKTYLPLGIFAMIISSFNLLIHGTSETSLIFCCIIFALSFVLEHLLNKYHCEDTNEAKTKQQVVNPLFEFFNTMNEINLNKIRVLETFNHLSVNMQNDLAALQSNTNKTIDFIDDYIKNENTRTGVLANNIAICNNTFEKLAKSVVNLENNAKSLNTKLSSTAAALVNIENAELFIKDCNKTFPGMVREQSVEYGKQIQRLINNLSEISYKCAFFSDIPKPYKESIDLYSVKIESIFSLLPKYFDKIKPQDSSEQALSLPKEKVCYACGKPIRPTAKFCGSCGTKVV